jgi:hypothetical protein
MVVTSSYSCLPRACFLFEEKKVDRTEIKNECLVEGTKKKMNRCAIFYKKKIYVSQIRYFDEWQV